MDDTKGKVALITGASSGIGRAAALKFAAEGLKVAAVARREEKLQEVVQTIRNQGGRAEAIAACNDMGSIVGSAAADKMILEECLTGREVSLLAFTDGVTIKAMPPAQDHKRVLDGDKGPNTGGMGAYAPAPICPPALVNEMTRSILQPTIDGLRAEDRSFVGVLYAGLMLTVDGPRVLEYNCRFGDPETQVILPLLETDLVEVAEACATQQLDKITLSWRQQSAACVVLASEGYPNKYPTGREIAGLDQSTEETLIFHAGTKVIEDKIVTSGGRVLNVIGVGANLPSALKKAYGSIELVSFAGMQYRHDIGQHALEAEQ